MEVKIQIESNQIGETVIDLFKNLSPEKKEELALSIMREWLQSPEFFETKAKEQLLIDGFRDGTYSPYGYGEKFDQDTPESRIRSDYNFQKYIKEYKTSKQICMEEIKNEVILYYKKYILEQIVDHDKLNKIKEETYEEVAKMFPSIVFQSLVSVFASNLSYLQGSIQKTTNDTMMNTGIIEAIRSKLNL